MAYRSDGHAAHALAQGMGWVSIGLGLAELLAPGNLARFLGMEERTELIRVYGMREIATGVGILSQDDPTPWMWGRVGGDMLDLGTPAAGLRRSNPQRENVGLAIAAVAGVTLLDVFCAQALSRKPGESRHCGFETTAGGEACRARRLRCEGSHATSPSRATCVFRRRCARTQAECERSESYGKGSSDSQSAASATSGFGTRRTLVIAGRCRLLRSSSK